MVASHLTAPPPLYTLSTRPNTAQGEEPSAQLRQIGERLREERKRLGISIAQLAVETGLSRNMVGLYELGQHQPKASFLSDLDALGLDVTYIVTGRRGIDTPAQLGQLLQRWALADPALARQVVAAIRDGGGVSVYFPKVAP